MSNVQIPNLPAAISLSGAELLEIVQAGTSARTSISAIWNNGSWPVGGTTTQILYNNAGAIGGLASFTTDGTKLILSGSSASDLLRITQTGAGNALLVEDATNPDSTPFVVDTNGSVGVGLTTPLNKLDLVGSFGRGAPVTKTSSFSLAATENWVICNGAGSITVTLPAAASWTGREVMLKTIAAQTVVSASSNVVPLAGGAAGTAILAGTAGKWATLVSDGTNWIVMQAN